MAVKKILIVEDEGIIAMTLRTVFEGLGYGVADIAMTGPEAIELARTHRPDLVLMDIKLDGNMDGIEAARLIRENADIPILFLSGNVDPDTVARARAVGPAGFVSKTVIEDRELKRVVEKALNGTSGK